MYKCSKCSATVACSGKQCNNAPPSDKSTSEVGNKTPRRASVLRDPPLPSPLYLLNRANISQRGCVNPPPGSIREEHTLQSSDPPRSLPEGTAAAAASAWRWDGLIASERARPTSAPRKQRCFLPPSPSTIVAFPQSRYHCRSRKGRRDNGRSEGRRRR